MDTPISSTLVGDDKVVNGKTGVPEGGLTTDALGNDCAAIVIGPEMDTQTETEQPL
jgi:hypothetical protein